MCVLVCILEFPQGALEAVQSQTDLDSSRFPYEWQHKEKRDILEGKFLMMFNRMLCLFWVTGYNVRHHGYRV